MTREVKKYYLDMKILKIQVVIAFLIIIATIITIITLKESIYMKMFCSLIVVPEILMVLGSYSIVRSNICQDIAINDEFSVNTSTWD